MFKKNNGPIGEKIDTLIGKSSNFEGTLKADGTVRVDGKFVGDIHAKEAIIIGEEGSLLGNITANDAIVSGTVEGNIHATNQLKINATGKVLGDIYVKSFIVEEKAIFEGNCKMADAVKIDKVTPLNSKSAKA